MMNQLQSGGGRRGPTHECRAIESVPWPRLVPECSFSNVTGCDCSDGLVCECSLGADTFCEGADRVESRWASLGSAGSNLTKRAPEGKSPGMALMSLGAASQEEKKQQFY